LGCNFVLLFHVTKFKKYTLSICELIAASVQSLACA
jgi:hypothetical protein